MATAAHKLVVPENTRFNGKTPWSVHYTSRVLRSDKILLSPGVRKSFAVSGGCYIQARNGIIIGEGTIFAPGTKLISADHSIDKTKRHWQSAPPIKIGRECWIGANTVILPGVEIGESVVVGAGSVVTKSFPADVVVIGNPAKTARSLVKSSDGS